MPIRVNLKEIFPSDPQEINVEKLNFNFNKLLELGVGSPGPIGLTGPQGPAGPIGLVGPQGDRGATWWVDAGDPNTITFSEPLMDGDMYLDQTSNVFQIYQYDALTSTWNTVVSIAAIVNSYLSSVSPSPFTTGPTGVPASSTKFVVFDNQVNSPAESAAKYLDYVNDAVRGVTNPSNNKTLFLTNFDENNLIANGVSLIWPANQNTLYTSLFKVVAAHDDIEFSVKAELGRYHLEFGSLYKDGTDSILSDLKHNLKVKFYKRYIGLGSGELPLTNDWINTAKFSLSLPEPFIPTQVDQNGEFEFVVPKYNNEGTPVKEEIYVRLGSAESFAEQTNKAAILADGISITNDQVGRSMVVGLREDLGAVLDLPYSSTNFALFDVSDDVDGLFFNKTLIQTGGNFEQIITSDPIQLDLDTFYTSATTGHFMSQGIWVGSNTVWVISGAGNTTSRTSTGIIQSYDISNPKLPVRVTFKIGNKSNSLAASTSSLDQHGHNTDDQDNLAIGLGKDLAEYGKYVITLHHRGSTISGDDTDLYIHETDSFVNSTFAVGSLTSSYTQDAYRVQVHGKYAWVITNRTYSTGPQLESAGSLVAGQIASIDLTSPEVPIVSDTYIDTADSILSGWGSKYLDFDICDSKAFVLRYTNYVDDVTFTGPDAHQLDILMFDITDPTNFSSLTYLFDNGITPPTTVQASPQDSLNLETLAVNTTRTEFGGICTNGRLVYAVWEDSLYLAEVTTSNIALRSTTTLSADPVNACDIVVRGNYAYILLNYGDGTGGVQVWDVSDKAAPFIVSELRNANLANSSRISISGKYIYVVSNTGTNSELITLDVTGIISPAAQIGAIKTNDLQVDGSAHIKNNLQVKNSLNVGPGGIYIDGGQGLVSDGIISTNISIDDNNKIFGGFSVIANGITQSAATSSNVNINSSLFQNINIYDSLNLGIHYLLNTSGSVKYIRGGFIGNQILRLSGSQYYGHSTAPLTNAFIGSQILLGSAGSIDRMYGNLIGHDINLGSGVQLQTYDAYGYKFNFSGSSTGTVYGLHIQGADENLLEGTTTIDDVLQLTPRSTAPTGSNGMMYYNSVTNKLMLYAGGSWVALN